MVARSFDEAAAAEGKPCSLATILRCLGWLKGPESFSLRFFGILNSLEDSGSNIGLQIEKFDLRHVAVCSRPTELCRLPTHVGVLLSRLDCLRGSSATSR